jgi:hypothetical protein
MCRCRQRGVASCPAVRHHRWPSSPDATSERDRRQARMRTCMQTLPCGVVVRCVPRVALRAACVTPECFGAGRLCSAPPVQATDNAAVRHCGRRPGATVAPPASITNACGCTQGAYDRHLLVERLTLAFPLLLLVLRRGACQKRTAATDWSDRPARPAARANVRGRRMCCAAARTSQSLRASSFVRICLRNNAS